MIFQKLQRKHILMIMVLSVLLLVIGLSVFGTTRGTFKSAQKDCPKNLVDTSNSSLELIHILFRHGARTPVNTYPSDPYFKDDFFPTGWGHVTNKGKQDLYNLGAWLKVRYGEFMSSYYLPDEVHAQASASPRALMSLSTVLASLFSPKNTPMEWNSDLNWQPIPIFSEPIEQDSLLLVRTSCPRYFEAQAEVLELPEVKAEYAKYEFLFRNLTQLTGMPIRNADDINSVYITLQAEKEFGLALPEWTYDYFPHKMQFMAEQSYIYNAYTSEMQKIKGGPFLLKTFNEMLAKSDGTLHPKVRKMFIYTGHDWTVANILSALKVWERQLPIFSVMTIFELHKNVVTGEFYVEIFLRNNEDGCIEQLKLPHCDLKCPLQRVISLSHDVLPNEPYEVRCRAKNSKFVEPPPRQVD